MNEMIIIVGAGAAGLMAARELTAKEKKVILLEGNNRTGGRIHTIQPEGFTKPIEEASEFVHGALPLTLKLLKEANIHYVPVSGKMETFQNGQFKQQHEFTVGWDELIEEMEELKTDMPLADFLRQHFGGEKYAGLRRSVQRFAEGFDLADIEKASVLAIRREWANEEDEQYRIPGGYHQLVTFLEQQATAQGCGIHLECIVKTIRWKQSEVEVSCANGKTFTGNKVIIAVPIGVLQAPPSHKTALKFEPAIDEFSQAINNIGFGTVIKVLLQFKEPFWKEKIKDLGFILSEMVVPTWWTQLPDENPLLTGWLGGLLATSLYSNEKKDYSKLCQLALQSLANIFDKDVNELREQLVAWHIADWHNNEFSRGAYSYYMLETEEALKVLNRSVQDTLFFAGEGCYDGPWGGTVEAALESGRDVAARII